MRRTVRRRICVACALVFLALFQVAQTVHEVGPRLVGALMLMHLALRGTNHCRILEQAALGRSAEKATPTVPTCSSEMQVVAEVEVAGFEESQDSLNHRQACLQE